MATHIKAHTKGKNRKEVRNARLEMDALNDSEALFGRVMKPRGDGNFQICVQDPEHRDRLLDDQHGHLAGKATARININDVILCAESGRGGKAGKRQFEILGSMSKKSVHQLLQQKRIHPALIVEKTGNSMDDDAIEFDYDDESGELNPVVKPTKAAKTAEFAAAAAPSKADRIAECQEDLDIDNI